MKIVEIQGRRYEIDETTAKLVEEFRIGDRVKVLEKPYGDTFKVYSGIIVGFADFKDLPTIEVMYMEPDRWSADTFKIAAINSKSGDNIQIAKVCDEEIMVEKDNIIAKFDRAIVAKHDEIDALELKKHYFVTRFASAFEKQIKAAAPETIS